MGELGVGGYGKFMEMWECRGGRNLGG
jgi:hypothetical protein